MRSSKKAAKSVPLSDILQQGEAVPSNNASLKRYIVANWKMNKTIQEAAKYVQELLPLLPERLDDSLNIWLSIPFTTFQSVRELLKETSILFGAQNMNDASSGSFTGEVAASMLKDAGCSFVIIGHSERRRFFHETDEFVQKKLKRAIESDLLPILCIGETFEERESLQTDAVLERQIRIATEGLSKDALKKIILAYEPVWAIGTGKSATSEIIQTAHDHITKVCQSLLEDNSQHLPILYGGSVTPQNANDLIQIPNVSGFLIGTASLDPHSFAKIIEKCV